MFFHVQNKKPNIKYSDILSLKGLLPILPIIFWYKVMQIKDRLLPQTSMDGISGLNNLMLEAEVIAYQS